jgi:hypothetical protein
MRRKARDLRLLRGELVERVHGPLAGALACGLQLGPGALGERLHPEVGEEVVGDPQLLACVKASALASQPLTVEQMSPREVQKQACGLQTGDRLAVKRLGCFPSIEECPRARFDAQCPRGTAGARRFAQHVPGYIEAPANALAYPWKHFIGGHLGRLGTRDDVAVYQQYMTDIAASVRTALGTVDPTPYFQKYGENVWAGVKGYLDAVTNAAAAPVIAKYTGVLAAADVFTPSTTFWVMESIRLDLGYASYVHP